MFLQVTKLKPGKGDHDGTVPFDAKRHLVSATFRTERLVFAYGCFSGSTTFFELREYIARFYSCHPLHSWHPVLHSIDDIRLWFDADNSIRFSMRARIVDESLRIKDLNLKDDCRIIVEVTGKFHYGYLETKIQQTRDSFTVDLRAVSMFECFNTYSRK